MKKNFFFVFSILLSSAVFGQNTFPGPVGIGTNAPLEKLHVENGNIYLNGNTTANGVRQNFFYWSGHNLVMGSRPGIYAHNVVQLLPGGSSDGALNSTFQMYVTPNPTTSNLRVQMQAQGITFFNGGNVGINTTTPAARFEVNGQTLISGGANLTFKAPESLPDDAGDVVFTASNNTEYARIYSEKGGVALKFSVGSTPSAKMTITNSGNVGIGILTPKDEYKLAVGGTIGARRIKVTQETWADFVLQPGYCLPGLSEIEDYINKHQHLPEMPSAAEVQKDGLDIGEMNKKLLQKVEELTLYLIEINKEILILKEKNEQLEKMINQVNK